MPPKTSPLLSLRLDFIEYTYYALNVIIEDMNVMSLVEAMMSVNQMWQCDNLRSYNVKRG